MVLQRTILPKEQPFGVFPIEVPGQHIREIIEGTGLLISQGISF